MRSFEAGYNDIEAIRLWKCGDGDKDAVKREHWLHGEAVRAVCYYLDGQIGEQGVKASYRRRLVPLFRLTTITIKYCFWLNRLNLYACLNCMFFLLTFLTKKRAHAGRAVHGQRRDSLGL